MTFVGFWDDATATAFAVELDAAMDTLARAGCRPGTYLYHADFRGAAIWSPAMVERFQRFAASAGTKALRVAILVGSTLQKMQTKRMAEAYDHYGFFQSGEDAEAEAWLLGHASANRGT
ncbi:hypothetical protein [Sphingomonas immobilis]|uniref:STAS/SEC14 domain-containing protein n=1 Tax=Sphingomonas immobilis TaxID=3063997 RepID=A0ABT9A3R2_9SPHN|nr:hypothetical protein [Sphingomonas sp. CA1-15]MDO7844482.1 hypothetical protein [Sphingomonas sp. CA1-15]